MQAVGAALHSHTDHGAAAKAVFGRVGVGLDPELLQSLYRRHEIGDVDARIFGVGSIQTDHLKYLAYTVGADGEACAGNRKSTQTVAAPGAVPELHAWNENRQAHHVAAIQRQLDDALVLDDAADVGGLCVQNHGRSRHFDGL